MPSCMNLTGALLLGMRSQRISRAAVFSLVLSSRLARVLMMLFMNRGRSE